MGSTFNSKSDKDFVLSTPITPAYAFVTPCTSRFGEQYQGFKGSSVITVNTCSNDRQPSTKPTMDNNKKT